MRLSKSDMDILFPKSDGAPLTVGSVDGGGVVVVGDVYANAHNVSPARTVQGADVVCLTIDGKQIILGSNAFHA